MRLKLRLHNRLYVRTPYRPADSGATILAAHEKARPPVRLNRAIRQQKSETGGAFPCSGRREESIGKAGFRQSHLTILVSGASGSFRQPGSFARTPDLRSPAGLSQPASAIARRGDKVTTTSSAQKTHSGDRITTAHGSGELPSVTSAHLTEYSSVNELAIPMPGPLKNREKKHKIEGKNHCIGL